MVKSQGHESVEQARVSWANQGRGRTLTALDED